MFDWLSYLMTPYSYEDYLKNKATETAIKTGNVSVTATATPVNTSMPWYITATIVAVGGILLYKFGAKILKV